MKKTKEQFGRAQSRYKKNYDALCGSNLKSSTKVIHKDDYVYHRGKRKKPKEHVHKLAPIAEGPYKVLKVYNSKVVIEKTNWPVQQVSRSIVLLAPPP